MHVIRAKMLHRLHRGFTLVELLITIGVICVLLVGIIIALNPFEQIKKSRDAERKSDLHQIQAALELYYHDNDRYPPSDTLGIKIGSYPFNAEWPGYMSKIPNDPFAGDTTSDTARHYQYVALQGGQAFCLYAHLERGAKDKAVCNNGNRCQSLITNHLSEIYYHCGKIGASPPEPCNYAVCSQNVSP